MALQRWIDRIRSRCGGERAQTMAEYAVVLAVITPAIVLGFGQIRDASIAVITRVAGYFT
jgi:Flp pilus assembly pilin Flp